MRELLRDNACCSLDYKLLVNRIHIRQLTSVELAWTNYTSENHLTIGLVRYINILTRLPRLLGQTSIFGVVFFVSKSLLGIYNFTRKPRSHVRILIYRT